MKYIITSEERDFILKILEETPAKYSYFVIGKLLNLPEQQAIQVAAKDLPEKVKQIEEN